MDPAKNSSIIAVLRMYDNQDIQMKQSGFTLIELLVVTSILAVLASIMFPVFKQGRDSAYSSVCLSNLSQIGELVDVYASDYDDNLPYAPSNNDKYYVLHGYQVYGYPIDEQIAVMPDFSSLLGNYGSQSKLFQCPLDYLNAYDLTLFPHGSSLFENEGSSYAYNDYYPLVIHEPLEAFSDPTDEVISWDQLGYFHGDRRNALFADFHVESVDQAQQTAILRGS